MGRDIEPQPAETRRHHDVKQSRCHQPVMDFRQYRPVALGLGCLFAEQWHQRAGARQDFGAVDPAAFRPESLHHEPVEGKCDLGTRRLRPSNGAAPVSPIP